MKKKKDRSSQGRKKTLANGLTPKQDKFLKVIAGQIEETGETNGTQAALAVYNTTDKSTANQIARDNLRNPTIKKTIEDMLAGVGTSSDEIVGNIARIASQTPDEYKDSTILKANLSILKLLGHDGKGQSPTTGRSKKTTVQHLSYDEARKQMTLVTQEASEFFNDHETTPEL